MTYIDDARDALLRQYPSLANKPRLTDLYLLLVLVRGHDVTLQDVHDAWAVYRSKSDSTRPPHPDLKPFEELSSPTQAKDEPFRQHILAAVNQLERTRADMP